MVDYYVGCYVYWFVGNGVEKGKVLYKKVFGVGSVFDLFWLEGWILFFWNGGYEMFDGWFFVCGWVMVFLFWKMLDGGMKMKKGVFGRMFFFVVILFFICLV